jgi:predicted RNase H-related nuclease YkuK (DUF458 family)
MEKYFKTQSGERVNVVEHTLEQIQKWPNLRIYVGTDSQDYGKITRFVTCVCYRYGHRGAHFIYLKEEVPTIRDVFSRLFTEGVRTIDAAQLITEEIPIAIEALEFDYSNIKKTRSTPVVQQLSGWVKGLIMKASFKSGEQLATKAADHICRHPELYK